MSITPSPVFSGSPKLLSLTCEHGHRSVVSPGDIVAPPTGCSQCSNTNIEDEWVRIDNSEYTAKALHDVELSLAGVRLESNLPAGLESAGTSDASKVCCDAGNTSLSPGSASTDLGLATTTKLAKHNQQECTKCWTCQLFDLSCDGRLPCRMCESQIKGDRMYLTCQRDRVPHRIRGAIPDLGLGLANWSLPVNDRIYFHISTAHHPSSSSYIFNDFKQSDFGRETCLKQPPVAMDGFLRQFYDINWHWGSCYEEYTCNLYKLCAEYQATLLSSKDSSDLSVIPCNEHTVIAHALTMLGAYARNLPPGYKRHDP